MQYKRLWIALAVVIFVSFAVLGGVGVKIIRNAPPVPQQVVTPDGQVLFDGDSIKDGQGVWQSLGGQQVGSIWGHGAYIAPDWSADWLHRESRFILDRWAREVGTASFESLSPEHQAGLKGRLEALMRTNSYDPEKGRITIEPVRAEAFQALSVYYADIFSQGRDEYAIPRGALTDSEKARQMSTFFWWTS